MVEGGVGVLLAAGGQAYSGHPAAGHQVGGVGAEDALSKRTKQEFFQRLAAYRIPYLDLQDTLSNVPEAQRWRLVFPHDGHWNEAGHAYFVRPIIQVIEEAVSTRAR